ncbi:MAG TPA: TIGR03546 family protein [Gemmatimonadales bacterium]|nr:TIGR03546 family protein [Gemmatimonadales bacterium]
MLLLKLLQQLIRALNSDGTPGQVAAGLALGSALGLTPLINLHNAVIFGVVTLANVSFPGAMLGWALCVPLGFALDPLFHALGSRLLLETPALTALWTAVYNTPVLSLANLNNTVVLGSLVVWLVLAVPLFFATRLGVARYREHVYQRLARTRFFKAITASKLYNVYRLFEPQ